jgi:hypothetical protein
MVSDFTLNTAPSCSYFSYTHIKSTTIFSKMVSDFILNTFPFSSYFSYTHIKSTTTPSKMVSDFTLNTVPFCSYFSYIISKLITISSNMVSFFILGLSFFFLLTWVLLSISEKLKGNLCRLRCLLSPLLCSRVIDILLRI